MTSTGALVARELVRSGHLVRSMRLAPYVTSVAAVAAYLVARLGDTRDAVGDLRVLALLLALGCGYALDDSAAATLQASPYGLARRLGLRIGCAAALVVPVWAAVLAIYLPSAPAADRWSLGLGLTTEPAAAVAVLWAVAAWARRQGFDEPGIITTPVLLASLLLAASIPRLPMLVGPGREWTPAHLRWSGIAVAATCALVAAMRDPAARLGSWGPIFRRTKS
ncbi:hypothetical protein [Actinoplanes subtropicus]|uniref:hypothetical protein n=1 Tax=Actinoplanes subtropicus TaxID=543632 RepID=UPI0012FA72AF|nr:hypothetical protein [Actinoplanes subtropicus]